MSLGPCGATLVLCLAMAETAGAQAGAWHTLAAPVAAFDLAGIPAEGHRALLMLRLIRVVHSMPAGVETVEALRIRLATLFGEIDALQNQAARAPLGQISLALAATRDGRDVLKDVLESAGLRLRERRTVFSVDSEDDYDEAARRQRLTAAGIDVSALARRLNAGETVTIAPTTVDLPLPLAPQLWSDIVFERPVPPRALFGAIIGDRRASLLYYGLASLTPSTLDYVRTNPELLRWLHRERSAALAAFGGALRVASGRVSVPGGEIARPLWEATVDRAVTEPEEFLKRVLGRDDGRFAYFYESVDLLKGPRQRFALGIAITDGGVRLERFRALYRAFAEVDSEWSQSNLPFARPIYDAASLLQNAIVTPDGALASPALRKFWHIAFESMDLPDQPARTVRDVADDGVLDAAAMAEVIGLSLGAGRRERFEIFAFGQRALGRLPQDKPGDLLVALRGFARFPALMLLAERLGISSAPLYASLARRAATIEQIADPAEQIPVQSQFQGALAVLDRLARTSRLDPQAIESLVTSLTALEPTGPDGYRGAVAEWIERALGPALVRPSSAPARHVEPEIVAGLADVESEPNQGFEWEGQAYVVSIAATETRRIEAIRAKQGGNTLDAVLALSRDARALAAPDITMDRIKALAATVRAHGATLTAPKAWPGLQEGQAPSLPKTLDRAARELGKIRKPADISKAARAGRPLLDLADYLLGEVLVAMAYAPVLGNPDDLLGGTADVAHRHDFGYGSVGTAQTRKRAPWLRPRHTSGNTVTGAVLGIDLVLARNALRRLASDRVPELPRLNLNDREAFTVSAAQLNPRDMKDADLAWMAAAIRQGRRRVVGAGTDPAALDALAQAARLSATRRQVLPWAATHDAGGVVHLFSMEELFALGRSAEPNGWPRWLGLTEEPISGCYCTRYPEAGPWETYSGRPGTGQLATRVPDLLLRVVELLDDLKAPALLLPAVMALATQDFIDQAPVTHADDWPAVVAFARSLTRERMEDYIAALTAGGPLRPRATGH